MTHAFRTQVIVGTRLSSLLLSAAFLLASVQTSLSEESSLDKAKAKYAGTLEKIEKDHANHLRTWPARYVGKLKRLQTKIKEQGDLEAWETVDKEIARYKEDRLLTHENVVEGSGYLERVQEEYIGLRSGYDEKKHRNIIKLRDSYVSVLTKIQKSLTRKGDIDAAHQAKQEIARVNDSEAVTSAQFAMAHASAIKTESNEEPETKDQERESRTKPPAGESTEGVEIHAAGKIPPRKDGVHFKRKLLTRSKHSPMGSKVGVTLMESNQIKQTGHTSRRYYWRTSTSTKSHYRSVRLGLRSSGTDKPIEDLFVHVQHYSKPFNRGANDDPTNLRTRRPIYLPSRKQNCTLTSPPFP
jgi:hypothetical protein